MTGWVLGAVRTDPGAKSGTGRGDPIFGSVQNLGVGRRHFEEKWAPIQEWVMLANHEDVMLLNQIQEVGQPVQVC
jgi:hypothetical protein